MTALSDFWTRRRFATSPRTPEKWVFKRVWCGPAPHTPGRPTISQHTKGPGAPTTPHALIKNIFGGDLLSHTPTGCSTISAKSLNYRVRNETGCTPLAITTEKPTTTTTHTCGRETYFFQITPQHTGVVIPKPYSERDTPNMPYKPSRQQ